MEYVYAAMLLHSAKQNVNEANVKKVLEAAGVKPEEGRVKALVSALDGVNIEEAIKEASSMQMMAAAPAASEAPAAKKEEKKEEKKDETAAAAGLGSLFG